jgi:hypothetical protein
MHGSGAWASMPQAQGGYYAGGGRGMYNNAEAHQHGMSWLQQQQEAFANQNTNAWTLQNEAADEFWNTGVPLTVAARINKVTLQLEQSKAPDVDENRSQLGGIGSDASAIASSAGDLKSNAPSALFSLDTSSFYCQVEVVMQTAPVSRWDVEAEDGFPYSAIPPGSPLLQQKAGAKSLSASISEPLTGEISGMLVGVDLRTMQTLLELAPQAKRASTHTKAQSTAKHPEPKRYSPADRRAGAKDNHGSNGMEAGLLPFPVLLHLQNFKMSLSAPFSRDPLESAGSSNERCKSQDDTPSTPGQLAPDRTFTGQITLAMVSGKVEGGSGQGSLVSIDLEAGIQGEPRGAPPVVYISYEEWEHVVRPPGTPPDPNPSHDSSSDESLNKRKSTKKQTDSAGEMIKVRESLHRHSHALVFCTRHQVFCGSCCMKIAVAVRVSTCIPILDCYSQSLTNAYSRTRR